MDQPKTLLPQQPIQYAFFGSADFSVSVLDEMATAGFLPALVVTTPDKPQGRKLVLTPTPVKVWAEKRTIKVISPEKLDAAFEEFLKHETTDFKIAVFIVAAYGKIIPETILNLPPRMALNIHPSLLPQYRGASPIHAAMIDDVKNTGVTVMLVDKLMDHGPIVAQRKIIIDTWPTYELLENMLAKEGADLLVSILPNWVANTPSIKTQMLEQDHSRATFTKKITKEAGLIDINTALAGSPEEQYKIFRMIQAYHDWPSAYFFTETKKRIKITDAAWQNGKLIIKKIIPEGKTETDFAAYMRANSAIAI